MTGKTLIEREVGTPFRQPFTYANPAPWPSDHGRPAVPLGVDTQATPTPHTVCASSYAAVNEYLAHAKFNYKAVEVGPCVLYPGRAHFFVGPRE